MTLIKVFDSIVERIIFVKKKIRARVTEGRHLAVIQQPCYNGFGNKSARFQS